MIDEAGTLETMICLLPLTISGWHSCSDNLNLRIPRSFSKGMKRSESRRMTRWKSFGIPPGMLFAGTFFLWHFYNHKRVNTTKASSQVFLMFLVFCMAIAFCSNDQIHIILSLPQESIRKLTDFRDGCGTWDDQIHTWIWTSPRKFQCLSFGDNLPQL